MGWHSCRELRTYTGHHKQFNNISSTATIQVEVYETKLSKIGFKFLKIEHNISDIVTSRTVHPGSKSVLPNLLLVTTGGSSTITPVSLEQFPQIASPTLACKVGIISWRGETDGLGSTSEHVADVIGQGLHFISCEIHLVVDNMIVGGLGCSLDTTMGWGRPYELRI